MPFEAILGGCHVTYIQVALEHLVRVGDNRATWWFRVTVRVGVRVRGGGLEG